jgi:hypothetical protein
MKPSKRRKFHKTKQDQLLMILSHCCKIAQQKISLFYIIGIIIFKFLERSREDKSIRDK